MSTRGKYCLALTLLLVGGVLCLGWAIESILGLLELAPTDSTPLRILDAFGPLGIVLVILGIILCQWNLPALRRQADEE